MNSIIKSSKAIVDFILQQFCIIGHAIALTGFYRFANRPLSVILAPVVAWWTAKADVPDRDNRHYFVSSRPRMGIHGRGLYTRLPVVVITGTYNVEIEELMKDRMRIEPTFIMGTRDEIMSHVKGLTNRDFDNAYDMDYYRVEGIVDYVDTMIAAAVNPQSVFRHWLQTQVNKDKITSIDGYVFIQRNPHAPMRNCEVGDFLAKYYDSFEAARDLGMHNSYRNIDTLARYLLGEITKVNFEVLDFFEFEEINARIRDRNQAVMPVMGNVVKVVSVPDEPTSADLMARTDLLALQNTPPDLPVGRRNADLDDKVVQTHLRLPTNRFKDGVIDYRLDGANAFAKPEQAITLQSIGFVIGAGGLRRYFEIDVSNIKPIEHTTNSQYQTLLMLYVLPLDNSIFSPMSGDTNIIFNVTFNFGKRTEFVFEVIYRSLYIANMDAQGNIKYEDAEVLARHFGSKEIEVTYYDIITTASPLVKYKPEFIFEGSEYQSRSNASVKPTPPFGRVGYEHEMPKPHRVNASNLNIS